MNKEHIQRQLVDALRSENIKLTPQRQAIFSNIMSSDKHRGCKDISNSLIRDRINISKATMYRTLDIIVKYNLIRKLVIGGKAKYEKKLANHTMII